MQSDNESALTIGEIAQRLKCARGWVQLSIDAGCPIDEEGKLTLRDFMLFQLNNIGKIRELAGLEPVAEEGAREDLRVNVKTILTTQLEWLQLRSSRDCVKQAAQLVRSKLEAIPNA